VSNERRGGVPDSNAVRIYRIDDRRYGPPIDLRLDAGDVLTTPALPALNLPLVAVFGG
jgi:hypothetical protein